MTENTSIKPTSKNRSPLNFLDLFSAGGAGFIGEVGCSIKLIDW